MHILHCLKKLGQSSLVFVSFFCSYGVVFAAPCGPKDSITNIFDYTASFTATQNYIGYGTVWLPFTINKSYFLAPPCDNNRRINTYWHLVPGPGMTTSATIGDTTWLDIPENDYLQVAVQVYIHGGVRKYFSVPDYDINNLCGSPTSGCGNNFYSGGRINLKVRLKKKLVGQSLLKNREVASIYASTSPGENTPQAIAIVRLSYAFNAPQSCALNAGQIIEFDLGPVSSSGFTRAGTGQPVENINPVEKPMSVVCRGVDASQMISARIVSANPVGSILSSSNKDVGFQMLDENNQVLIPNNSNSTIPFSLDQSGKGAFILKSRIMSLTGLKPAAGKVRAEGHIRIDYK